MSVLWQNDCQIPTPNGTTVNVSNSTGGSTENAIGTPQTGSGNTFVSDTSKSLLSGDTQSWKLTQASTVVNKQLIPAISAQTHWSMDTLWEFSTAPSASAVVVFRAYTDSGFATTFLSFDITSTRHLEIVDALGTGNNTSTGTLTAGSAYYLVAEYNQATLTATFTAYAVGSGTIVAQAVISAATGVAASSASIQSQTFGIQTASSGIGSTWHSHMRVMSGAPSARVDISAVAPTASAGPDQTGVEPWSTGAMAASMSSNDGGTVTGAWTHTSGPVLTLADATSPTTAFTCPASLSDQTAVYTWTVTDSVGSSNTASDTVSITILAATEAYLNSSGTWMPMQIVPL